jgi:hypothetical protein
LALYGGALYLSPVGFLLWHLPAPRLSKAKQVDMVLRYLAWLAFANTTEWSARIRPIYSLGRYNGVEKNSFMGRGHQEYRFYFAHFTRDRHSLDNT